MRPSSMRRHMCVSCNKKDVDDVESKSFTSSSDESGSDPKKMKAKQEKKKKRREQKALRKQKAKEKAEKDAARKAEQEKVAAEREAKKEKEKREKLCSDSLKLLAPAILSMEAVLASPGVRKLGAGVASAAHSKLQELKIISKTCKDKNTGDHELMPLKDALCMTHAIALSSLKSWCRARCIYTGRRAQPHAPLHACAIWFVTVCSIGMRGSQPSGPGNSCRGEPACICAPLRVTVDAHCAIPLSVGTYPRDDTCHMHGANSRMQCKLCSRRI